MGSQGTLFLGMKVGTAIIENSMKVPQKLKIVFPSDTSNSISGYISKENEIAIWKRYRNACVHCSIIHNSQDVETT